MQIQIFTIVIEKLESQQRFLSSTNYYNKYSEYWIFRTYFERYVHSVYFLHFQTSRKCIKVRSLFVSNGISKYSVWSIQYVHTI